MKRRIPDAVALASIVLFAVVVSLAIPGDRWDRLLAVAGTMIVEVPFCIYLWYGDRAPRMSGAGWLGAALVSLVVGAISFAIDVWVGWNHHPDLPALAAALKSGPGLCVTVGAFPLATFAFLASAVREFVNRQARSEERVTEQP